MPPVSGGFLGSGGSGGPGISPSAWLGISSQISFDMLLPICRWSITFETLDTYCLQLVSRFEWASTRTKNLQVHPPRFLSMALHCRSTEPGIPPYSVRLSRGSLRPAHCGWPIPCFERAVSVLVPERTRSLVAVGRIFQLSVALRTLKHENVIVAEFAKLKDAVLYCERHRLLTPQPKPPHSRILAPSTMNLRSS